MPSGIPSATQGRWWLLGGSLLATVVGVPYLLGRGMSLWKANADSLSTPAIVLTVPPAALDLGAIGFDETLVRTLPNTNFGCESVSMRRFTKSCECTRIVSDSLTIPPGETREIRLTLNFTPPSESELAMRERPVAVTVKPEIGLPSQSVPPQLIEWWITDTVLSPYRVTPAMLDFEEWVIAGKHFAPRTAWGWYAPRTPTPTTPSSGPPSPPPGQPSP